MRVNRNDTLVAKYGSSSVVDRRGRLDQTKLNDYAEGWKEYRDPADERMGLVIVSSGAVAVGRSLWLEYKGKDTPMPDRQQLATYGSDEASQAWKHAFGKGPQRVLTGQVLVTHHDLHQAGRGVNSLAQIFRGHIESGTVPIVNENDAIKDEEMRYLALEPDPNRDKLYSAENDGTGSLTAQVVGARALMLLGQTRGILGPNGDVIREIPFDRDVHTAVDEQLQDAAGSVHGTGGPAQKLAAGLSAAEQGIHVFVAHAEADPADILNGSEGTYIYPNTSAS